MDPRSAAEDREGQQRLRVAAVEWTPDRQRGAVAGGDEMGDVGLAKKADDDEQTRGVEEGLVGETGADRAEGHSSERRPGGPNAADCPTGRDGGG